MIEILNHTKPDRPLEACIELRETGSGKTLTLTARVAGTHLGPAKHDMVVAIEHTGEPLIKVYEPIGHLTVAIPVDDKTIVDGNIGRMVERMRKLDQRLADIRDAFDQLDLPDDPEFYDDHEPMTAALAPRKLEKAWALIMGGVD